MKRLFSTSLVTAIKTVKKHIKGDVKMTLSPEAREARNRYLREWRKKNPNKVKEHQANYWERQAEKYEQDQKEMKA